MLKLRRVNEAKTMFEKGFDALFDFFKERASKKGLRAVKKDGTGFFITGPRRSSVHISLSLKEAMDGVYTLSIDGVVGRKWRFSDHEILDPKSGKMKLYDKKAQIDNLLDVAKATIDKMLSTVGKQEVDPKVKDDNEEKTEGVRRLSRIPFI